MMNHGTVLLALLLLGSHAGALAGGASQYAVVGVDCGAELERVLVENEAKEIVPRRCQEKVLVYLSQSGQKASIEEDFGRDGTSVIVEKPGWPVTIPGTLSQSTVSVGNLGSSSGLGTLFGQNDGTVRALGPDGQALPGWPAPSGRAGVTFPVIGDLDDDGLDEVILLFGGIDVFGADGISRAGWPLAPPTGEGHLLPIVTPLGMSGTMSVVAISNRGQLTALDQFGNQEAGFPVRLPPGDFPRSSIIGIAVGDIDNDGFVEVVGTELFNFRVFIYDNEGEMRPNFPVTVTPVGKPLSLPLLGDLDGDGVVEIVFRNGNDVNVMEPDGSLRVGWPQTTKAAGGLVALGDVDGDGRLEIAIATVNGGDERAGGVYLWNDDGTPVPGWPRFVNNVSFPGTVTMADVDGDGVADVVVPGLTAFLASDGVIYAWKATGELIAGFPIIVRSRPIIGTATVVDLEGDGVADLGVMSETGLFAVVPARIHWFDLGVPYRPEGMQWPTARHDMSRTGFYSPPVRHADMEVEVRPAVIQGQTPAPPLTVLIRLGSNSSGTVPAEIRLVKVNGVAVSEVSGSVLGKSSGSGGHGRLTFRFDGDAVRALLPAPGIHTLTFRSEVIGGVGGIQFEGEATLIVGGAPPAPAGRKPGA